MPKTTGKIRARLSTVFHRRSKLIGLIKAAHLNELSIEEMINSPVAQGRNAGLISVVSEVLLDLKQQRAERAALEQETRDRIANRTDALERKIGSLQLQAARDALTGLGNRRALDLELPRVVDAFQSRSIDACLLMIDVDHFKQLNDTLGHAAGDQLLREIGQLIRSNLRGNDLAFRCGGDEFVVLLQDSDLAAGMALSERLGSLVFGLTQRLAVALPPQLSIGACVLSEVKDPSPERFLHTADSRLYAVKALRPRAKRSA